MVEQHPESLSLALLDFPSSPYARLIAQNCKAEKGGFLVKDQTRRSKAEKDG
jgi:hypothetical protein